jgi:hypothetical protein
MQSYISKQEKEMSIGKDMLNEFKGPLVDLEDVALKYNLTVNEVKKQIETFEKEKTLFGIVSENKYIVINEN